MSKVEELQSSEVAATTSEEKHCLTPEQNMERDNIVHISLNEEASQSIKERTANAFFLEGSGCLRKDERHPCLVRASCFDGYLIPMKESDNALIERYSSQFNLREVFDPIIEESKEVQRLSGILQFLTHKERNLAREVLMHCNSNGLILKEAIKEPDPILQSLLNDRDVLQKDAKALKKQIEHYKKNPSSEGFFFFCEPEPLGRAEVEQKRYPVEALGTTLGDTALVLHDAIQAPLSICAHGLLGAAALVLQGHADVTIDGRTYPLSLYLLTVGESGERKTAIENVALEPIWRWQKEAMKKYREDRKKFLTAKELWSQKKAQFLKRKSSENCLEAIGSEPAPPLKPFMLIDEPTYEGLVKLFSESLPTIGLFSDEGGRMFGGYSMREENILKTAAGLSSMWSGKPLSMVRSRDEERYQLFGRRFSTHLMVQGIVFAKVFSNTLLKEQGFLARFLTVKPESQIGKRLYKDSNPIEDPAVQKYYGFLEEVLRQSLPYEAKEDPLQGLKPRSLFLSSEAKQLWIEFFNGIEIRTGSGKDLELIKEFASKAGEQALRLAGVLSLVDDFSAECVPTEVMERAVILMHFYVEEYLRITSSANLDPTVTTAKRLLNWLHRQGKRFFIHSEIYRNGPSEIRDAETARSFMHFLAKHGEGDIVKCCGSCP